MIHLRFLLIFLCFNVAILSLPGVATAETNSSHALRLWLKCGKLYNPNKPDEVSRNMEVCSDAVAYLQLAALDGDSDAMYKLAIHYLNGSTHTKQNRAVSTEFFRRAADAGNVEAMAAYADALSKGIGVERDIVKAIKYAWEPAYIFNLEAQVVLTRGLFELEDFVGAMAWRDIACVNGWRFGPDDEYYLVVTQKHVDKKKVLKKIKSIHRKHRYIVDDMDVNDLGTCIFSSEHDTEQKP